MRLLQIQGRSHFTVVKLRGVADNAEDAAISSCLNRQNVDFFAYGVFPL
jgi:hypothetical protein